MTQEPGVNRHIEPIYHFDDRYLVAGDANSFIRKAESFYKHGEPFRMKPRRQFDTGADASRNDTALKRAEPGRSGRLRVRSLVVRGLAAVLLAAFAALLSLPPVAPAQTAVPGAPTALTATADGTTEIDLS